MRPNSLIVLAIPLLAISTNVAFALPGVRPASPGISGVHRVAADTAGITLEHVWARPSPGNATMGAAYLTVIGGGLPDRLIGISSPAAAKTEVHETINDNGVLKMRAVPSMVLEPGKPVAFQPGGYHVMLMGLKSPLKLGDSFPLTLTFEHAAPITVMTTVEAPRSDAAAATGHDHGTMAAAPVAAAGTMQGHGDHKP